MGDDEAVLRGSGFGGDGSCVSRAVQPVLYRIISCTRDGFESWVEFVAVKLISSHGKSSSLGNNSIDSEN